MVAPVGVVDRRALVLVVCVAGCSSGGGDESASGVDTFGPSAPSTGASASGAETTASLPGSTTDEPAATSTPAGSSSAADSTGDAPKFDLGTQADMGGVEQICPEDALMVDDNGECAIAPVLYDRDAGLLTLSITKGQLYDLTDPEVEVIFATDQLGYEGFFTIAREVGVPDVFYVVIADDDFMHLEPDGECGITLGACETDCMPSAGGDVCRAFVDDFIPIVASAYIGTPYDVDTFGRRSAPNGVCCSDDFTCNATIDTYTEHVVTGPAGTMHFIFQDGFAFLDTRGWDYEPRENVNGDAQFEFDLCDLPVPAG